MTATMLGWIIAGISVAAFITLWFTVTYKELSVKRISLKTISEQVKVHRRLLMQERGGENDTAAKYILENKLMVYREIEKDYNTLLRRPLNRIPGYVMGFRPGNREYEM